MWRSITAQVKVRKATIWTLPDLVRVPFSPMRPTAARPDASPPDAGAGGPVGRHGFPWDAPDDGAGPDPHAADGFPPAAGWGATAGAAPWAPPAVGTEVPALDAVIDGSVDVPGTFRDKDRATRRTKGRGLRRPGAGRRRARGSGEAPQPGTSEPGTSEPSPPDGSSPVPPAPGATAPGTLQRSSRRTRRGASAPRASTPRAMASRAADLRAAGLAAGSTAVGIARRPAPGIWARRTTLLGAAAVALVVGVGAGAAVDTLGSRAGADASSATAVATASPESCAAAQVAWSRAAAAQVEMDVESPATLRTGFTTARAALTAVEPPDAVAAEWDTVATYVTAAADAAEGAGKGEVESAIATALARMDTAAMTTASEQVTHYLAEDCRP